MLIIYFVVQLMGYFVQTDWSGDTSQIEWVDTSSYLDFNLIDGRTTKGNLKLYTPSEVWETSKELSVYQINAIQTGNNGIIYLGCGIDSTRVIKLANYGDSIVFNKVIQLSGNPGQVLSILRLSNENLVVGTERGDIFLLQDTVATWKFQPGYKIQTLCNDGSWVYAGMETGKIYWSTTNGATWNLGDTSRIPGTSSIYSIKPFNGFLYACTQSTTGQGQIYKSVNNGRNWTIVNTFAGVEAVYSMAEDYKHNLYVSTGYSGKIFKSSNSGTSWQEIPSPWQTADFYSIICNPMGVIYTAGQCLGMSKTVKGMVFSTKNEGVTWDTVFEYPTGALPTRIISMIQSNEGFMVIGGDTNVCFISGYADSGWLVSSVYDAFDSLPRINNSLKFINMHYTCNTGDSIKVKVRSSQYPDSLGDWGNDVSNDSDPTKYGGGAKNGDRYIQYKVNLKTDNTYKSPNLSEIYIKYSIDIEEPIIDSIILSDSLVKWNSYAFIYFNKYIDRFSVNSSNIDSIFRLSDNHSWRSDGGKGIIKAPGEWITSSVLKISLSTLKIGVGEGYPPTIAPGDTVYPDSSVIQDTLGNPCLQPVIISVKTAVSENNEKLYPELSITPNPFNHLSTMSYSVPFKSNVSIKIYDCTGRLSKTLINEEKQKGTYFMKLENNNLTRGIYFVKFIMNGNIISTKKVILVSVKK